MLFFPFKLTFMTWVVGAVQWCEEGWHSGQGSWLSPCVGQTESV